MEHFPYQLMRSDAELVIKALRSYLSRQLVGDGAVQGMQILRDELEILLEMDRDTAP